MCFHILQKILFQTFSWSFSLWCSCSRLSLLTLMMMTNRKVCVPQVQVCNLFRFNIKTFRFFQWFQLFFILFSDVLERCYLRQVHNCVYFAVKVLENQFQWVVCLSCATVSVIGVYQHTALHRSSSLLELIPNDIFLQVGCSFGQMHPASAGRERKGGVFLSGSQRPSDSGSGQKHSQGNTLPQRNLLLLQQHLF